MALLHLLCAAHSSNIDDLINWELLFVLLCLEFLPETLELGLLDLNTFGNLAVEVECVLNCYRVVSN